MISFRDILSKISILENDDNVIHSKFAQKLSHKKGMYKPDDINIPVSPTDQEPFVRFETQDNPNGKVFHIVGVRKDGRKEKISTTNSKEVNEILAQIYNSGGYTDKQIQKVRLKDGKIIENKIVVSDCVVSPKKSIVKYQKSSDKNTNFMEAENQKKYYEDLIFQLSNEVEDAKPYDKGIGGLSGVRVKSRNGRIDTKIEEKNGDASLISDYLGGAIEVKSLKAMKNILRKIRESNHRILEIDNMLSGRDNDEGYRAVHLQVQLNNGFSAELQLLPAGIARIKEELHPIYEKYRTPEAEERAKHDIEFKTKMENTHNKLKQAYAKAFEEFKKF